MERVKKYNKKHHSVADWNFSSTNYTLDTSIYISEPSSLRFNAIGLYALLKQASAGGPIPEGIIESYFRFAAGANGSYGLFSFRNQAPDGQASLNYTYWIGLLATEYGSGKPFNQAQFAYLIGGTLYPLETKTISPVLYPDTWYLLRVKFWVYDNVLMVAFEYWNGSEWVKLCGDFSDPNNRWATSSVNRVGIISVIAYSPRYSWFDNTRIFRRVS